MTVVCEAQATMVINPGNVDAYLARKGIAPRICDAEWEAILQRIAELFGHKLWHRCRLVHQLDETWSRYSTSFPDAVPQPYRHIHHLEILVCSSPQLQGLEQWLTARGVEWHEQSQRNPDAEKDEVVALQICGYADGVSADCCR